MNQPVKTNVNQTTSLQPPVENIKISVTLKPENKKAKAILYFLIGLFFNYLGLIIGALWVKFRAKTNQKTKFVSLLIGFIVFALFSYIVSPYIIQPQVEKFLYSKYPELQNVKTAVEGNYPEGKVDVTANWTSSLGATTTSAISVRYNSKNQLTIVDLQNMGKLICDTLHATGKEYDFISIISVRTLLPISVPLLNLNKTFYVTATCDEFYNKDMSNIKFPL